MNFQKYISELRKRNVFKASIGYVLFSWVLIQVASILLPIYDYQPEKLKPVIIGLVLFFPLWLILSWIYDLKKSGIEKTSNKGVEKTYNRINGIALSLISILSLGIGYMLFDSLYGSSDEANSKIQNVYIKNDLITSVQNDNHLSQLKSILPNIIDPYSFKTGDSIIMLLNADDRILYLNISNEENNKEIYYWGNDSISGYFDYEGRNIINPFLRAPIEIYEGVKRIKNVNREDLNSEQQSNYFKEEDLTENQIVYKIEVGKPVYSIGDGKIEMATYKQSHGNYLRIKHDSIISSQYENLMKFAPGIRIGAIVLKGGLIGYSGATGNTSDPQLGFKLIKGSELVHFEDLSIPNPKFIPRSQIEKYRNSIDKLGRIEDF